MQIVAKNTHDLQVVVVRQEVDCGDFRFRSDGRLVVRVADRTRHGEGAVHSPAACVHQSPSCQTVNINTRLSVECARRISERSTRVHVTTGLRTQVTRRIVQEKQVAKNANANERTTSGGGVESSSSNTSRADEELKAQTRTQTNCRSRGREARDAARVVHRIHTCTECRQAGRRKQVNRQHE